MQEGRRTMQEGRVKNHSERCVTGLRGQLTSLFRNTGAEIDDRTRPLVTGLASNSSSPAATAMRLAPWSTSRSAPALSTTGFQWAVRMPLAIQAGCMCGLGMRSALKSG
jgi:hypothetical protein